MKCPICELPGELHESCRKAASPAPYQILLWATNHKVETLDKLTAPALKKLLRKVMDWSSDHMVINMRKCFLCGERTTHIYNCLPICKGHYDRVNPAREIKTDDVHKTIDAVYAHHSAPRPSHREVCSNPRIRHSYLIKTPAGYLQYDGNLVAEEHLAHRWTRDEVEIESARFQDLGTPLSITRVIR